jgi:hypothetical protein
MREFKFFHGIESHGLTAIMEPELAYNLNLYDDITHMLSEEIAREVDLEVLRQVARRVNGGGNDNLQYLNHYINMEGGNRA